MGSTILGSVVRKGLVEEVTSHRALKGMKKQTSTGLGKKVTGSGKNRYKSTV